MHTIQQIIDNQKKFEDKIYSFFLVETDEARKTLRGIDSENDFFIKEKEKLLKKFKKLSTRDAVKRFFFMSSKRDENQYVWWSEEQEEAIILKYGKK